MGGMTTSAISAEAEQTYRSLPLSEILEDLSSRFIVNLPKEELGSITRIGFQVEQAHWFYEDFLRPINPSLPSLSLRNFSSQLLRTASHTVPLIKQYIKSSSNKQGIQDLEAAFEEFIMYKTRVPVCGIILINESFDKCLLVKGWKSNSTWGFPKGKINQSEPKRDCAIREVFEETGFDSTDLLKPDSKDYMDLTMKDQKIRLYIVKGVDEDTVFETRTRKEISKIAWFPLESLPTWKKSKSANDISSGKFYMVSPFVARLKQWIKVNKNRASNAGSGGFGIDGGIAQGEDGFQDGDESFDHHRSSTPTEPAALRNNGYQSNPNAPSNAPTGPAADRQHLTQQNHFNQEQQPTSEGLKALLGFSNNHASFASSSKNTLDSPQVSHQNPLNNAMAPDPQSDPLFNGKGSNMIQQHSDPRSHQLLELLRGAAAPAINSEHHQNQDQSFNPTIQDQQTFGGSRAWEDVAREKDETGAASLLAALRSGSGQANVSTTTTTQESSHHQNKNLLDLLNGTRAPNNSSNQNNQQIETKQPSSDPFNPYPSGISSHQQQDYPSNPHLLQPRPPPAISPLPAPRAHNVALAQSLLKMMSPAQGSFSFAMPPAASPDVGNSSHLKEEIGLNGNGNQNEIIKRERNRASDGRIVTNGEEEAERERARKRDALLASLMGGLQTQPNEGQIQSQDLNNGGLIGESGNEQNGNPNANAQARNLLNLLNPPSGMIAESLYQERNLLRQQPNQFDSTSSPQNQLKQVEQAHLPHPEERPFYPHQPPSFNSPSLATTNPFPHPSSVPAAAAPPAQPLSDREIRLREAQNRDRAMNFKFPPSGSNGESVTSSPQQSRTNQTSNTNNNNRDGNVAAGPGSNGLLSLLNGNGGIPNQSNDGGPLNLQGQSKPPVNNYENSSTLLNVLNSSSPQKPFPQLPQFSNQRIGLEREPTQSQGQPLPYNPSYQAQVPFQSRPGVDQGWIHSPNQNQHQQNLLHSMNQQPSFPSPQVMHQQQQQPQQGFPPQFIQQQQRSFYDQRIPPQMRAAQPPFQGYGSNLPLNGGFPIGGMR